MKIYNLAFLLLLLLPFSPPIRHNCQQPGQMKWENENVVLKSTDGGQTWKDISEGLPENWNEGYFFGNQSGLYINTGHQLYYTTPDAKDPFWKKEFFPDENGRIAVSSTGMFAYNWDGRFFQKINGTAVWSPVHTNFQEKDIRSIFETAAGTVFIGHDRGLYKSTDNGKTWKEVYTGGWVIKLVESNGVLMATSQRGILRSADNGETWERVLYEGGVGIAIEPIEGGFAAITSNTKLTARTVRASYDGGKTWQPIDTGLPLDLRTSSIIEFNGNFFCGHPAGIFKSSDKGQTWKLLLPPLQNKVFNLFVSGNVLYAVPRSGGC